jgi:hypothetical protein
MLALNESEVSKSETNSDIKNSCLPAGGRNSKSSHRDSGAQEEGF